MRPFFILLGLPALIAMAGTPGVRAAGDQVFAGTQVHTIDLTFSQSSFWDSLTVYYNAGEEQYMVTTVTADGVVYDSAGVRFKGNASYTHPKDKKPFRLAFDQYRPDQRWDDLKAVHLNNCWEDSTFLREKLHCDFDRNASIPAPRATFAELSINGELWGFYSLVEHVDKTLLSPRYGNNDGNRCKAVDELLGAPISDFKRYGSDPIASQNRYELKTVEDPITWTDLIAIIDPLSNSPSTVTALPPVVNMCALCGAFGADLLFSNLDSCVGAVAVSTSTSTKRQTRCSGFSGTWA